MTYNPSDILTTALYFATKSENYYYGLTNFARAIPSKTPVTPEDILASEFLLTQGLRFNFDVRHPYRAFDGAIMDLTAIARSDMPALPGNFPLPAKPKDMAQRTQNATGVARTYMKENALLTDVYFHFTPSQIMMACLHHADPELADWYIRAKIPAVNPASQKMLDKVLAAVLRCRYMMESYDQNATFDRSLAKKLRKCRNPEKVDLVGLQRAKREGDDVQDEKTVKKRKLEREQSAKEGEDLFGPGLTKA